MIVEHLRELAEPIGKVHPYPGNPRVGDVEVIKMSLAEHGQFKPIVANLRTGDILAGNHVWQAACELLWTEVAVAWVDVDEEQARKIVLVDNRAAELGSFDGDALAELLSELSEEALADVGYSTADLDELLASVAPPDGEAGAEDDDDDDFKPFTAYEEFATKGAPAGHGSGDSISTNTDQWVNLRLVDLRVRVSREAYTRIYEALLRECGNDQKKASAALARKMGFAPDEIESK